MFRIHIILIWIRGNFWFCESDFPYSSLIYYVNIKLLKIILKNFRHVKCNNTFSNHFDLFILWFWLIFVATRIHINGFLIRIHTDPDPKHCLKENCIRIGHSWRVKIRSLVSDPWYTILGIRSLVFDPWYSILGIRSLVYDPWYSILGIRSRRFF